MPPDPLEGDHAKHALSALRTLCMHPQVATPSSATALVTNSGPPIVFLLCYAPARNGCDGRLMVKILITTIHMNLCFGTKFI